MKNDKNYDQHEINLTINKALELNNDIHKRINDTHAVLLKRVISLETTVDLLTQLISDLGNKHRKLLKKIKE
tara:strand:+ start:776 stop:991 length:216 start_codon:yes stop_codon:yes gene_type:complete